MAICHILTIQQHKLLSHVKGIDLKVNQEILKIQIFPIHPNFKHTKFELFKPQCHSPHVASSEWVGQSCIFHCQFIIWKPGWKLPMMTFQVWFSNICFCFQGEPISFDDAVFVASRPLALQPFLQVNMNYLNHSAIRHMWRVVKLN